MCMYVYVCVCMCTCMCTYMSAARSLYVPYSLLINLPRSINVCNTNIHMYIVSMVQCVLYLCSNYTENIMPAQLRNCYNTCIREVLQQYVIYIYI